MPTQVSTPEDLKRLEDKIDALALVVTGHHTDPPPDPPPVEPPVEPPEPLPPPVVPPPTTGVAYNIVAGAPTDYRKRRLFFSDPMERLSGIVAPPVYAGHARWQHKEGEQPGPQNIEYTVNGERIGSEINTLLFPDGPYSIGVICSMTDVATNGQTFAINNSGSPVKSLRQPVHDTTRRSHINSITVDVQPRFAQPLRYYDSDKPTTPEESLSMTGKRWAAEGLTVSAPTGYDMAANYLFKNMEGDWIAHPLIVRWDVSPTNSKPWFDQAPAFDGPRGICDANPYSTIVHLQNAPAEWMYLGKDGRIALLSDAGEMTTIYGPRSVEGEVQTHPLVGLDLDARVFAGEKEVIGDPADQLQMPTDGWLDPTDADRFWVADDLGGEIVKLSISQKAIVKRYALPNVRSVWICHQMRDSGVDVYATTPEGLHTFYRDARPPSFLPISGASWVRGKQSDSNPANSRLYVMTDRGAFWEIDPNTNAFRQTVLPQVGKQLWSFFDTDPNGLIGQRGKIYCSWGNSPGSNTGVNMVQPNHAGQWGAVERARFNVSPDQGSQVEVHGHYVWGFSISGCCSSFLSWGCAENGPILKRAYLDRDLAGVSYEWQHPFFHRGKSLWLNGKGNVPGISIVFASQGSGALGYSFDLFAYQDRDTVAALLEPFRHTVYDDAEWDDIIDYVRFAAPKDHF